MRKERKVVTSSVRLGIRTHRYPEGYTFKCGKRRKWAPPPFRLGIRTSEDPGGFTFHFGKKVKVFIPQICPSKPAVTESSTKVALPKLSLQL